MNVHFCTFLFYEHTFVFMDITFWIYSYPYQAINRLSKGSLSTDVESMRTKSFDKCIKNEMEEDIRKEQKKMREDIIELQQQVAENTQEIHNINTRHIPLNIRSKLIVIFSVQLKLRGCLIPFITLWLGAEGVGW